MRLTLALLAITTAALLVHVEWVSLTAGWARLARGLS